MVTTPDGAPVAMVHTNNCSSDLNAWVSLFGEFAEAMDYELAKMVTDSVKEYSLPAEDEERFSRINICLSKLDWDKIKDIINERS